MLPEQLTVWVNKALIYVDKLQNVLNFEGSDSHPQFSGMYSLGRIGVTGFALGIVVGFHFCLYLCLLVMGTSSLFGLSLSTWCLYVTLLGLFHFLEFFLTSLRQPTDLSYNSFIVNHSQNYTIAVLASCVEYWLGTLVLGRLKFGFRFFHYLGLLLVLLGQGIRSLAMWQCGESFNHTIAHVKPDDHKLVTTGIYRYLRHPSYFGWFYWSIGMQLLLCNPICFVAYAYTSWSFFHMRIEYEEQMLLSFYKEQYLDYMQRSFIGIPLLDGQKQRGKDT